MDITDTHDTQPSESNETSGQGADGALRSSLCIPIPKAMLGHAKPDTQLPLTNQELRNICRAEGLAVSGVKANLQGRLIDRE